MVPLPPIAIFPNLENGRERVVMLGESFRITITSDGLLGMSLDAILPTGLVVEWTVAGGAICGLFKRGVDKTQVGRERA